MLDTHNSLIDTGLVIHIDAFKPRRQPRPALMTHWCNGWLPNPAYTGQDEEPLLVQCQHEATRRLVVDDGLDCYTQKLCSRCAAVTRREVARDGNDIVSDVPLSD